jgi:hypothetical protein
VTYLYPYFEHDVFVSYSHGDRRGGSDTPLKSWTLDLIQRLETDIHAVDTEFDDLQIWRDEQIDPTVHLSDELRDKVVGSGILMIVMSPRYLASTWCKEELQWFRQQVQDRACDPGRVFVIRALPTDEGHWPEFLRDDRGHGLVGFSFHDPSSSMPYGWRGSYENNEVYVRQLWRLQNALVKRLRELRDNRTRSTKQHAKCSNLRPTGPHRIYLHARTEDAPVRDEVKRILTEDGIAPLTTETEPGGALANWNRESRIRIEAAKICDASALVRANDDERFEGDLLQIGIDERDRIQSSRGVPLPCAVLDRSGQKLPIDVSPFGIERFDLISPDWRGKFRGWLDSSREQSAASL